MKQVKKSKKKWSKPSMEELPITMEISAYRCADMGEE